jgi:tetratricopeptide (TPR) repeat protein
MGRRWIAACLATAFALALAGCGGRGARAESLRDYQHGRKLVLKKEYAEARKAFTTCLAQQPDYAPAHLELGMLCEGPLEDLLGAALHYRAFLRLAPESDQRPVVERWLARVERNLLRQLAKQYPDVAGGDARDELRSERDDLARRLQAAASLYRDLKNKNDALEARLAEAGQERVADLQKQVADAVRAAEAPAAPEPPKPAVTLPKPPPPKPAEPKKPEEDIRIHRIVDGDTLAGISRQYYGSVRYWPLLQTYNEDSLHGRTMLVRGKTLRIPPLAELKKSTTLKSGQ